jgi:hypothetical protein
MTTVVTQTKESVMFTTLAKTFFRASAFSPNRYQKKIPQSWYREDLRGQDGPKRWEDWR